jgi:hypothetical protein
MIRDTLATVGTHATTRDWLIEDYFWASKLGVGSRSQKHLSHTTALISQWRLESSAPKGRTGMPRESA